MKQNLRAMFMLVLLAIMPLTALGQNAGAVRDAFYNEVGHDVVGYVAVFMNFYDPNLTGNVSIQNPGSAAEWTDLMARLARLDNLCKTKYSNVTNDPNFPANFINGKPKIWCAIAANRVEYEKQARGAANHPASQRLHHDLEVRHQQSCYRPKRLCL